MAKRCELCSDTLEDAQYCVVPECTYRAAATPSPAPTVTATIPESVVEPLSEPLLRSVAQPRVSMNGMAGSAALPSPAAATSMTGGHTLRRLVTSGPEFLALIVGEMLAAVVPAIGILWSLAAAGYMATKDRKGGLFSMSKHFSGLRVVDAKTGMVPTDKQALLRNSYYVAGWLLAVIPGVEILGWSLLVFGGLIDMLMVLFDPRGRRLGDRIAGTVVAPPR